MQTRIKKLATKFHLKTPSNYEHMFLNCGVISLREEASPTRARVSFFCWLAVLRAVLTARCVGQVKLLLNEAWSLCSFTLHWLSESHKTTEVKGCVKWSCDREIAVPSTTPCSDTGTKQERKRGTCNCSALLYKSATATESLCFAMPRLQPFHLFWAALEKTKTALQMAKTGLKQYKANNIPRPIQKTRIIYQVWTTTSIVTLSPKIQLSS